MIMSKIAKVREIVSHLIANESIVSYLSKSTAIQIQKVAKEGKRDCLIFYSLGDDLFDIVFFSILTDISLIADDKKR